MYTLFAGVYLFTRLGTFSQATLVRKTVLESKV